MKVLTLKLGNGQITEFHALNPGEHFPNFGGSRDGLTVRKTASIIIHRTNTEGMAVDTEHDIFDPLFWAWIARLINDKPTGLVVETGEG